MATSTTPMQITIGGVLICEADMPASVALDGGTLKHTVLYTASGRKILKIAGLDLDDITLDGDLRETDRGGTPRHKARALAALRDAGQAVTFTYGARSIPDVTITAFKPEILFGNAVKYHLVLSRGTNGAPPLSATVSSQQQAERHGATIREHAPRVGPGTAAAAGTVAALLTARRGR